jgi:hypothetical protein
VTIAGVKDTLEAEQKLSCDRCKSVLGEVIRHYPVFTFGDPTGKSIIVVGINPSDTEYNTDHILSEEPLERQNKQLHYFDEREKVHRFFRKVEDFFEGEVKEKLQWGESPWEKVGFLDLVKCPTFPMWSKLTAKHVKVKGARRLLVNNCQGYLEEQLEQYAPRIIIAYGARVGKWFAQKYGDGKVMYKPLESSKITIADRKVDLLFVQQKQGPAHSEPDIKHVRDKLLEFLRIPDE